MDAVWEHVQGHIWLAPPQVYELSRLAHFSKGHQLREYASERQRSGVQRWLPVALRTSNGIMTVLPGTILLPQHLLYASLSTSTQYQMDVQYITPLTRIPHV